MKPTAYFPALTGLRAVAAYCVFLFHFPPLEATGSETARVLHAAFREGHIGVSLFFTLSGFLICQRYYQQCFTRQQLVAYAVRRWARIYPVFLLVTTITFFVSKLYVAENALELYVANSTLLKGFSERLAFTGIVQTWSLTVEECFYLLAPLLFWLGRRFSPRVWIGVVAGLLALGWAGYCLVPGQPLSFQAGHFMLVATIFGRSAEFVIGAAFALAVRPRSGGRATLAGGGLLLLVVGLLTAIQLYTGKVSIDTLPGVAANHLLLPAATGLLLVGLTTEASGLQRFLSTSSLQVLGKASYCFYLIHMGIWHDWLTTWLPTDLPAMLRYSGIFSLTVAASIGLYYLVEKPLHQLILRKTGLVAATRQPVLS
ncbi:acyltransferase family protein [Hymenobacter elongatus]|uniref:Acyltransferase n=1 Tax=Hymenobacter elongatus TaxID=877208 RepID=A0A4Z0PS14_9BACT|nr:acyltransferase [Hymenobacter elongatus]TGE20094.1 acyltransferase [Hymenobacter elongatus]